MKLYIRLVTTALARLLPVILAGDLLYLYYAGGWQDPIKLIEGLEVSLLWVFVLVYTAWTVVAINKMRKEVKDNETNKE